MHTAQEIEQKHVLFVDDDAISRRFVEKMLRSSIPGVHVTCAGDGAQALAVLDREPVDLLITDLAMPVIDGIELLLQVARRRLRIPLLVVTAHATPATESQALSGGAIECFEKPILQEPFIRCTRKLLFGAHHRELLDVVSLAGIVRLIGAEAKTCTLHVATAGAQGLLAFSNGDLVDARQGDVRGIRAALEILGWEDSSITLDPDVRPGPWTIHTSVVDLLGQARRSGGRLAQGERAATPMTAALPEQPPEFQAEAPEPALEFTEMFDDAEPTPSRARVVMPAPMPKPAAVRRRTSPTSDAPERSPSRPVGPPSLKTRAVAPRVGAPPPAPAPPRVAAPPRAPLARRAAASTRQADPPRVSAAPSPTAALAAPTTPPAAALSTITASPTIAAPPTITASAVRDEPAAPMTPTITASPTITAPVRDEPAAAPTNTAPTFQVPEDADCYQLQDLARELLRVAEYEAAELVLRRALAVRPGDRVVEQNLRALARRRALRSEAEHPRSP